jgi:hypothetical protein
MIANLSGQLTTSLWAFPGVAAAHRRVISPGDSAASDPAPAAEALRKLGADRTLSDPPLRDTVSDGVAALRGLPGRRALVVFSDGGDPTGLSAASMGDLGGVQVIVLSFGGPGCARLPLPALVAAGLLSCHTADESEPDEVLNDIREDLLAREDT